MEGSSEELLHEVAALKLRVEALERAVQAGISGRVSQPPHVENEAEPQMVSSSLPSVTKGSTLESRIGAQVFNRVGILAVLVGVAWFLKLAMDREWIGPGVRILLGLAVAVALVLWSERFRTRGFPGFAHALKALGTGIAYLCLWASFSLYHLLPASAAFAAMAAVTIANALLAWKQNSELLAAYALIGGLATPALLFTGRSEELFLFLYLLLLDIGAVALVSRRSWPRLVIGAFAGTTIYLGLWSSYLQLWWSPGFFPNDPALTGCFLALFFALFTAAPLLALRRTDTEHSASHATLLTRLPQAVAACTLAEAYDLLQVTHSPLPTASVALVLAFCYTCLTWGVRRSNSVQRLRATHLTLAAGLFAIAALLHFHGYGLPLCWLAETLALVLWAARPENGPLERPLRACAAAMSVDSSAGLLLLDFYDPQSHPLPFLNTHFATYLAGLAVFAAAIWFSRSSQSAVPFSLRRITLSSWAFIGGFAIIAFNLVALMAVDLQIDAFWRNHLPPGFAMHRLGYVEFTYSAWYMLYGAALMVAGFRRRSAFLRWQALILLAFSVVKVFLFDTSHLSQGYRVASFLGLGALLLAVSFAYQRDWLALRGDIRS